MGKHSLPWKSLCCFLLVYLLHSARAEAHRGPEKTHGAPTILLTALERALSYMAKNYQNMDIDGYLGVAIAQGQLERMDPTQDILVKKDWMAADYLLRIARNIHFSRKIAIVAEKILQPKRWQNIARDLNKTLHCSTNNKEREAVFKDHPKIVWNTPDEKESDMCLSQLMQLTDSIEIRNKGRVTCRMSHECHNLLTVGESQDYSLTHRILYHLISDVMGCKGDPVEQMCCQVYDEVKEIQAAGYPISTRDLFLEQILVCSLSGYGQFLQKPWLQLVVDWQRFPGCWGKGTTRGINLNDGMSRFKLIKNTRFRLSTGMKETPVNRREDIHRFGRSTRSLGPADCSTHTTGLGVALLALGARHAAALLAIDHFNTTNMEKY